LVDHPVTCQKMKFLTLILLLLAQSTTLAQGLTEPIEIYQEGAEEDLSWEEALPPLLPANGSEIGKL
jgi:hypothetical protein